MLAILAPRPLTAHVNEKWGQGALPPKGTNYAFFASYHRQSWSAPDYRGAPAQKVGLNQRAGRKILSPRVVKFITLNGTARIQVVADQDGQPQRNRRE